MSQTRDDGNSLQALLSFIELSYQIYYIQKDPE
jgi:hypothetical protein